MGSYMNDQDIKAFIERNAKERRIKHAQNEKAFVNMRSLLGNTWARFYIAIGSAQSGKTYAVTKLGLNLKKERGAQCKWYWLRLSETSQRQLLQDNASKLIDADLVRNYDLHLKTKGSNVYDLNRSDKDPLCTVLPLSTVYSQKGNAYFDKDFDGQYLIVLDEMNRDTYAGERNTFDVVYNFKRTLENLIRNTGSKQAKATARVVCLGNTMSEASDLLLSFGFIPDPGQFGRYKLRSKKLVLDYLPVTAAYKAMRQDSTVDIIKASNEAGFTNEIKADLSQISKKPLTKLQAIIKFKDDQSSWFTVYDDGVLSEYHGETGKTTIAMRRYLQGEIYNKDAADNIYALFDNKSFRYRNYYTQVKFRHELQLLKPQR